MTNNKQQTAVKLYTQEQLERGMDLANRNVSKKSILESLTPIELPTDEEIKKMMELDGMEFDELDPYDVSYLGGATWMRNKIQGGEQ
jgi:hypothetical protein